MQKICSLFLKAVAFLVAGGLVFVIQPVPNGLPVFRVSPVRADTADLVVSSCDVADVASDTCLSAISADGGSSYELVKGSHIDAPFNTLSTAAISSATLYYDSSGSMSGTWGIYVKDARDGSTICSVDPAPEDGSETTNSVGCDISTAQLSAGVWLQVINNDDKGPESAFLDYVRLHVEYTAISISISLATDGSVGFGYLPVSAIEDTTSGGINDVETISVDSGPADLVAKSTAWTDGGNSWSLSTASGSDQVKWEFSPDGSSWTTFAVAGTDYSLATQVANGGTQDVYFRINMPSSSSSLSQHSATVTVTASVP